MQVTIRRGENLAEALAKIHTAVELPCGGNGTCGFCKVTVQGFGNVKACQFRLPGTYEVKLPMQMKFEVIGAKELPFRGSGQEGESSLWTEKEQGMGNEPGQQPDGNEIPVIAVDVGTTTVALRGSLRGRTAEESFVNPQRSRGADVMSRIRYANGQGTKELQESLRRPLLHHIEKILKKLWEGGNPEAGQFCRVILAANTTMLHLLSGFSCEGLGRAPFSPVSLDWRREEWSLAGGIKAEVTMLPGISAFIGADIASGIYATGLWQEKEPVLLVDLGTNGEMALGCERRILAASAAAGPAFEGSGLALRIHGAGVLRCIHKMLQGGYVDETGLLQEPYFEEGFPAEPLLEEHLQKQITPEQEALPSEDLRIRQEDIRQIQMAKAAIRTGADILLREYGIAAEEIKRVYLAGGMGYYLDPEDAFGIGLLPESFRGKTFAAGNTSLAGALCCGKRGMEKAEAALDAICSITEEIVLANHPLFEDAYIENMNFPIGQRAGCAVVNLEEN